MDKVRKVIRFLRGTGEYHIPTKEEIAEKIDARLGDDNGGDDGRVIDIANERYTYYIIRRRVRKGKR
jgi:hypothetical protein